MTSFAPNFFLNSALIETIKDYWNHFTSLFSESPNLITENPSVLTFLENLPLSLTFDDFQIKLLKYFVCILCGNLFFVCIFWKYYGARICERFMKPATSKAIEELKASVSKLKLPKEHSPRI